MKRPFAGWRLYKRYRWFPVVVDAVHHLSALGENRHLGTGRRGRRPLRWGRYPGTGRRVGAIGGTHRSRPTGSCRCRGGIQPALAVTVTWARAAESSAPTPMIFAAAESLPRQPLVLLYHNCPLCSNLFCYYLYFFACRSIVHFHQAQALRRGGGAGLGPVTGGEDRRHVLRLPAAPAHLQ